MPVKKDTSQTSEIAITPLKRGSITLRIVGVMPLYQNRMSNKAKQTLFVGGQKKNQAERASIKHDPLEEFRSSAEIVKDGPTALGLKVVAVKGAMSTAALETPGLTKTAIQRLLFMPGDYAALYGTPQLKLDVVRQAGINRTPDIRSRAYLPRWGAEIAIQYIVPQLSLSSVVALLCNAGVLAGVGDFRQEKGKGAYGTFRVLGDGEKDAEWDELVRKHGRTAQETAFAKPQYADNETAELMAFFFAETKRRAA